MHFFFTSDLFRQVIKVHSKGCRHSELSLSCAQNLSRLLEVNIRYHMNLRNETSSSLFSSHIPLKMTMIWNFVGNVTSQNSDEEIRCLCDYGLHSAFETWSNTNCNQRVSSQWHIRSSRRLHRIWVSFFPQISFFNKNKIKNNSDDMDIGISLL